MDVGSGFGGDHWLSKIFNFRHATSRFFGKDFLGRRAPCLRIRTTLNANLASIAAGTVQIFLPGRESGMIRDVCMLWKPASWEKRRN